jgi:hypothetical protein
MDNSRLSREEPRRLSPSGIFGLVLIGIGTYLVWFVVWELWGFFQSGEHPFISLFVKKLGAEGFVFLNDGPVQLGSSAKTIIGTMVFLFLGYVAAGIATRLISTGATLVSPPMTRLKDSVRDLGDRVKALEKRR